jgi:hypothetical protein
VRHVGADDREALRAVHEKRLRPRMMAELETEPETETKKNGNFRE